MSLNLTCINLTKRRGIELICNTIDQLSAMKLYYFSPFLVRSESHFHVMKNLMHYGIFVPSLHETPAGFVLIFISLLKIKTSHELRHCCLMHVCSDAIQPVVTLIRTLFISRIVCTQLYAWFSVRSWKDILKSAYSQLTYSKTAVKGKITTVSEPLPFQKSICSTH